MSKNLVLVIPLIVSVINYLIYLEFRKKRRKKKEELIYELKNTYQNFAHSVGVLHLDSLECIWHDSFQDKPHSVFIDFKGRYLINDIEEYSDIVNAYLYNNREITKFKDKINLIINNADLQSSFMKQELQWYQDFFEPLDNLHDYVHEMSKYI